ncbi:DUF6544 family protein [Wenxinia marina]|uniref:Uncharacterized protein n=1 Tax=Wenxinia marina DSM 24838 TaxID=1123501 RepID=A0A0D0Q9V6_9RHOB|nr:DUF6544 family protein [Wenxinia marina]KIQ71189.1 hypothetical protein Wenmar_00568 [Wenxinia marina DSM 24838]GGL81798.1 hypothetical protein GCM10011392_40490 [Wenxinia marina]
MRMFALAGLSIVALAAIGLVAWRQLDHRQDRSEMSRLLALQPSDPPRFTASMVAGLPEPAQRYFRFAIAEGTPLYTVARLEMEGQFGMGDKSSPGYLPMSATQVLAAPQGFVWSMSGGSGVMRIGGSDSATWTRFWLAGLVPVARLGGAPDHSRSAFGRYAAEAVFWTPAAVLPGPHVSWEAVSETTARMTMEHDGLEQSVDVEVAEDGRPMLVSFERWSDANPEGRYRLQPFGGYLSDFQKFRGFTLPTHVEAGNFFGTEDYFPFFVVDVTEISFPG